MASVCIPLEHFFFKFISFNINLIFVLGYTHRKLLITNLSMCLYCSDFSIVPAH